MKNRDFVVETIEEVTENLKFQAYQLFSQKGQHVADDLRWNEIVKTSFKKKIRTTVVLDAHDNLLGICTWILSPKMLAHKTIVSGPFAGLGGMICQTEVESLLLDSMSNISDENRSALVIRTDIKKGKRDSLVNNELVFFEKEIGNEDILLELDKKLRYEVRKSFKQEVRCYELEKITDTRELSEFYSKAFQALGTPFFGKTYLENLQEVYKKDLIFLVLRDSYSKLIGAAVLIKIHNSIFVLHANTNEVGQELSAGYRLYFEIMTICQRHGAARVNFGRSIQGSNQASFKRKWGMQEKTVTFLRSKDCSQMFFYKKDVIQHNIFKWTWQHLPFWFVRIAGPFIARLII